MKICGVIAEYNPFHNGHAYHLAQTRANGATHIVAVMSPNFVQRGAPAIADKFVRAQCAVAGGVDLVLEMPTTYALSPAQLFAAGGIYLLDALGCVDLLSFGSESGDIAELRDIVHQLASPQFNLLIQQYSKEGVSYPRAHHMAVTKLYGEEFAESISSANNTLAVEYLRALDKASSPIRPMTVKRLFVEHDSSTSREEYASASYLRQLLKYGSLRHIRPFVPDICYELLHKAQENQRAIASLDRLEGPVLNQLRRMSQADFAVLYDAEEGLDNRMMRAARQAVSIQDFLSLVKTKRYTLSRLRRMMWCAFLGISKKDLVPPSYLRALAFNERGLEILKVAKKTSRLPVVTKYAQVAKLGAEAVRLFSLHARCTDLYALALPTPFPCGMDMTYKTEILREN